MFFFLFFSVPKPALCGLSEPDNVAAESGDDSEDEWNYFRVEQKPGQSTATTTTTIDTVLEKTSTEPNIEKIEDNLTGSSPVPPQAAVSFYKTFFHQHI